MEVVAALAELFRRGLPPVVAPLQVKPVCLGVLRIVLRQARLLFAAEFGGLQNFFRNFQTILKTFRAVLKSISAHRGA